MVESVGPHNRNEVDTFLAHHEESAQFLINNLRAHSAVLTNHQNSGNFKVIRRNGAITAVFCLTLRGRLIIQSEESEPNLILDTCANENVQIKSFIGDWNSVEPVYRLFKQRNPSYSPSFDSKEILYRYLLSSNDPKLKHDPRVRLLQSSDFPQWLELNAGYMSELGLPDELSFEQRRQEFESQVEDKVWWGLLKDEKLISRAALNSNGEKIGQVGGVFTPKQFRQNGYAKAVMFHMLKDCRDLHGHMKSILFTGETDFPAQKLYESMGYSRIGSFALILGN